MSQLQRRNRETDKQRSVARPQEGGASYFAENAPNASSSKEQVEQALDLILRRKWYILLTCLLVVAATAVYTYSQVPVYQTSTLVLVDKEETRSAGGIGEGNVSQGGGLLPSSSSIQNELMFLRNSQALRQNVAERLMDEGQANRLLHSNSESALGRLIAGAWQTDRQELEETEDAAPSSDSTSGEKQEYTSDSIAPLLAGRVQFNRASETNVVQISARDEDPEMAMHLANLYREEYIALSQRSNRSRAIASREFLEERAQELEQELEAAEQKMQQYQRQADAISLDERESSLTERIVTTESDLEQTRIELQMERASLESLQEELKAVQHDDLSERVGSTVNQEIAEFRSKIAELELSRQQLLLQPGTLSAADSAQVKQIERRIDPMRSRISELSDQYVDRLMAGGLTAEDDAQRVSELRRQITEKRIQISGLESRIEILNNRLEEYEQELDSVPAKSMEMAQLKREREYTERMYDFVTEQLQQARLREKSQLGYADTVAKASMPGAPVRPNPKRNLTLGLMLGLLGGAGLALLRDRTDNRIFKPDQIREMGYHGIGVIPNLTPLIEDQLGGQATVERDGRRLETGLVGALKPYSAATEAYRKVWTNLQLGRSDADSGTILVTSPGSGDGKSTTASNLAVITAQAGHSTLLIDGDLRRPRLHEMFDVSQTPGLTETLNNDLKDHAMKRPLADNFCVLPAGTQMENPAKVLASARLREFLSEAEQYFDYIVVDSSPVLATADGPMLSDLCDTTLCVVRAGATTEHELDHALEVLGKVGADTGGVVFNGFDLSMAYGYAYRYRHYGQYGPYDQYKSLPESTA